MGSTHFRLYDAHTERLMQERRTWGIGHEFEGAYSGLTVDTTWIKTDVTRCCRKRNYQADSDYEKVPEGTPMGKWKEKPLIAEALGCAHFFVKHSSDGRYRIEVEANYEYE